MKPKHTPGSWQSAYCSETGYYVREIPSFNMNSWPVPQAIIGELSGEAEANLIADLLNEVQTLTDVIEKGTETPEDLEGILDYSKSVLAKARGEK